MAAKKGHIEETQVSDAAKQGIKEINRGKGFVNLRGIYVYLLKRKEITMNMNNNWEIGDLKMKMQSQYQIFSKIIPH